MHKKFEINLTKIKDGCQSERKMVTNNAKSDLPLDVNIMGPEIRGKIKRWTLLTIPTVLIWIKNG